MKAAIGLDFGTESVRALVVGLDGTELATAASAYRHGQITEALPGGGAKLPPEHALQHPGDWEEAVAEAVRGALAACGPVEIVGIGVDFTSCTMLPVLADGTPLCLTERFSGTVQAWPKLWKHHGAGEQTARINAVARARGEGFLTRYGGEIGIEWLFPKILETYDKEPDVYDAAEVWLEAGDWLVWRLVGGDAASMPRSTCQAGYKGMWSAEDGYPSAGFFEEVRPGFSSVLGKLPGRLMAPGTNAGGLSAEWAERFRLEEGTPVSVAIIDAHAGVPGAGAAEEGTLVMVMGTSSCQMLNSTRMTDVPGVAGIVKDGILPGFHGYETGQAAVGDAFEWLRKLTGQADFRAMAAEADLLPPGAEGVFCVDWLNGCRTPLMDAGLRGMFGGLGLHHGPAHLYKALMEASAFGVKWIVGMLEESGVPVKRFVATGGLPHHNPSLVGIYADVLGKSINVHPCTQGPALGAAILGALAAGAFATPGEAILAMGRPGAGKVFTPDKERSDRYQELYPRYLEWAGILRAK